MVWKGSITEGEWTNATQLTPMGKVRQLRQQGKKAVFFQGAIVTFHDKNEREYCAIPKEYFKEIKPCYAKWETHKSSKEYPVSMWLGA